MSRRKLIAGNWKMNGLRADGLALADAVAGRRQAVEPAGSASDLPASDLPACDLLVCPPATLLAAVAGRLAGRGIAVGGQDCHAAAKGAHTGDVSAEMLADAGAAYVILGHSERRQDHGESDGLVRAKAEAAYRAGLIAVICVGETREERDAGRAEAVVTAQLEGSVPAAATPANTVIAYEPVWAIGTGLTATAADVAAMHGHIRRVLAGALAGGQASADATRILYGGSVKPGNAAELMALADVDGALVGGASLAADDFWAIAQTCR